LLLDTVTVPHFLIYNRDTMKAGSSGNYQFNGLGRNSSPNSSQTFIRFSGDTVVINHLINQMQTQSQQAYIWGLKQ
jgi:hypothetical protein